MRSKLVPHIRHATAGRGLAAIGIAVLMTAGLVTSAVADDKSVQSNGAVPGGYASWADLYAAQDKLDRAALAITAADGTGNASIVVSAVNREVQIYWAGGVPAAVRTAADSSGVKVKFLPARFTHAQLVTEAKRLAVAGDGIAGVAPKPDGSGLTVTVTAHDKAGLEGLTSIPVTTEVSPRAQAMVGRQADTPRFTGGSRYNSPVGGCTNGFALLHPHGPFYSVSAAHCATVGEYVADITIPGQPSPTGYSFAKLPCRDTLALGYAGMVAPRVYTGPFNSATSAHVAGAIPDFVGDLIATGGASSGEHHGVRVQAVNEFIPVGGIPCATVGPLTRASLPGRQCAVAPGDSGGPAYSYLAAGEVLGRGTNTAGLLGTADCPGVVPSGSNTLWYAPLLRPPGDPQLGSLQFGGVDILT